ncbi:MAG: aldo/keto reductase [Deltaproteobacteria bacterium]|nr:aldo/keto reductase [Deltaproteobacteria bacterium]
MRTRTLGRSGISVGEVGLGTWGISGEGYGPSLELTSRATLRAAIDAGGSFIETADCYREGEMLEWIGDLKRDVGADKVFASVRVGVNRDPVQPVPRKDFSGAYLTEACERALKRMGVEALDAMVLHNPSLKTLARGEAWTALRDLKTAGKVRLIGMSVGSEDIGRAALIRKPDLVVLPYNLFVPSMLHRLSSEISSSGAGVVVRSPLAYGLLADGWSGARRFSDDDHRLYRWTPRDLNHRMKQRDTLRQALVLPPVGSLREASLRYVLANALVSVVTPGARTPDQATENARCVETEPMFPDAVLGIIGRILDTAGIER